MKKSLLLPVLLIFLPLFLCAQELHTTAEVLKIMENSPVSYDINALDQEIALPDRSENLNDNNVYRVVDNGSIYTKAYEVSEQGKKYFDEAEEYYNQEKATEARDMYLKVLEVDPGYYKMMTYIGQMYEMEKDFNNAILWYKKAIEANYIDYMAHWFLADAYRRQGKSKEALDEITIAKILNRNNPRLQQSFLDICKMNKIHYADWSFNPQVKIDSTGVNKVSIYSEADWLGYALIKAVWMYEPGYKKSMGEEGSVISTKQEKECFIGLLSTASKKTYKRHPEFKALKRSIDKGYIDSYILYEVFLPEYPVIAYQLPEETIEAIKEYVLKVRSKVK